MNDHDQFRHVNLGAKTQNLGTKSDVASNAAHQAFEAGASPRAQLEAGRKAAGTERIGYLPHQGAKERMKRMKLAAISSS